MSDREELMKRLLGVQSLGWDAAGAAYDAIKADAKRIAELEADKAKLTVLVDELRHQIAGGQEWKIEFNAAAWSFVHTWINNEVDQDDDEWMDVMAELTAKADRLMRLCTPPIDAATQEQGK